MTKNKKFLTKFSVVFILTILLVCNSLNVMAQVDRLNSKDDDEFKYSIENLNENNKVDNGKIVYLTFDDGPSINNTLRVAKILTENNIKGTFFILGEKAETYEMIVKKLKSSGMCVLPHTYSHNVNKIYKNAEVYMEDLYKCFDVLEEILGEKPMNYARLPGGSFNQSCSKLVMKDILKKLNEADINYVDWNASAEDSYTKNPPVYKIRKTVFRQSKGKDVLVILMHDAYFNKTTVEMLPELIDHLKEEGYTFKSFDEMTEEDKKYMIEHKLINRKSLY